MGNFNKETFTLPMHTSYEKKLGHSADFKVTYRFYSKEEGGRVHLPFQGYRSDFWYDNEDHKGVFMIFPEFEDIEGNVILENNVCVPQSGTARMWIVVPERRLYHREKIKIGLVGYFMEGSKVGECKVIEILGLLNNPVHPTV